MPLDNVYIRLTHAFNRDRCRAVVTSGQAVVLHRLAIMSKDGDWILREDQETLDHVLDTLAARGAHYRFGAPLDLRWLAHGWSVHFEFQEDGLRIRTDFFTRPPRLDEAALANIWQQAEQSALPVVGIPELIRMKQTDRERDYAVIGELARRLEDPAEQLRYARSARDLLRLAEAHPDLVEQLRPERPVLEHIAEGRDALEAALDAERRRLMHANEERLAAYATTSAPWHERWSAVHERLATLPLPDAHCAMVAEAETHLPFRPAAGGAQP